MRSGRVGGRAARTVAGLVLAAVTVASIAAATVPAAAGEGGGTDGRPDPWPDTVSCATGAFTGHVFQEPDYTGPYLELSGWAQPCPDKNGEPRPARFGFAYMRAGFGPDKEPAIEGVLYANRLRGFGPADAPTSWSGRFDLWGTGEYRTQAPLCLMSDPNTRVACVLISMFPSGARPTATVVPIPLNDPAVASYRIVLVDGGHTTPECGACV
jgi:hypothetical protein